MVWKHYELIFRLTAPLHVGYRKVGNLMQTRPYLSGKQLWAFLTARLTRDMGRGNDPAAYVEVGNELKEYFRFSYLYPALLETPSVQICKREDLAIYFPWMEDKFDYYFLDSYASTAINHFVKNAEEESLHEVEFIRSFSRLRKDGVPLPVYMVGELWINEETRHDWRGALKDIQVGGERRYGWGKLKLAGCSEIDQKEPVFEARKGDFTHAHVVARDQEEEKILQGVVEPLVGWERNNSGGAEKRWQLSRPVIAFLPGSKVLVDTIFRIGDFGIWEKEGS